MNVTVIGRGNVGGGLAAFLRAAGHDDDALEATERLIRDAGLDPVRVGGLDCAPALEGFVLNVVFPVAQNRGPFLYRFG